VGEAGEDDASVIYTMYTQGVRTTLRASPGSAPTSGSSCVSAALRGTKSVAYECSGENASATAGGASAILSSLCRSSRIAGCGKTPPERHEVSGQKFPGPNDRSSSLGWLYSCRSQSSLLKEKISRIQPR
jgi:hypothetical protein